MINLNINGNIKTYVVENDEQGIKLSDVARDVEQEYSGYISLAVVNNELRELNTYIKEDSDITFLDTKNPDGLRVYTRTLNLVFIMACKCLFKDSRVVIEHSLSNGVYCEIHLGRPITQNDIAQIREKMDKIISRDYEINKTIYSKKEAIKIFESIGLNEKAELIKYKDGDTVKIYKCNNYIDHFYGYLMPSTGYIKSYDLFKYQNGVILMAASEEDKRIPKRFIPQPKLASIYKEAERWSDLMGVDKVLTLNEIIESGKYGEIIRIVEALHEKKIGQIADIIKQENKRIILIAAPSSSGKTSFATRLSIHLKVNNLNPISISLDNYFVDREKTPLDEFGNLDYESINAINLDRFNKDLNDLLEGKEVQLPKYNFITGKSEQGEILQINENQPIILEGIHGLNPVLTSSIPDDEKFKIYLSALTQLNLDDHNRIPTTDLRLIRRIVRDNQFRGHTAEMTIKGWPSVRRGEEKNIFPYQEQADIMFNTACVYELSLLKTYIKPLLEEIDKSSEAYIEAKRLLKLLQYFVELDDLSDIPPTAIIREFIGGSKIVH
ncbi:nucleoside kinase [Intestinibacter sp.]|uniref:nucleoside kinase n=1 Tax=Intestinibacter sp. TaxID=1965304 RepID=UPI002A90E112|nr:nucleoside kinase [Intestinibacter sp.]MDY5211360.1 nucleoside kinase [Intestinibacter sp.]